MDEKESQHVNSAAGCNDDTDGQARQEKEREVREKRDETRRLIERIVQATATAARKETENSEVQDRTLADQHTMAADEPHESNRVATWQNLVVPRGLAAVPEREKDTGSTTETETRDVTSVIVQGGSRISKAQWRGLEHKGEQRQSQQMDHDGETTERMGAKEKQGNVWQRGCCNETTRQAEWHTSAASTVNSTTYGNAVARIITARQREQKWQKHR